MGGWVLVLARSIPVMIAELGTCFNATAPFMKGKNPQILCTLRMAWYENLAAPENQRDTGILL
jgi:hypothetical protein